MSTEKLTIQIKTFYSSGFVHFDVMCFDFQVLVFHEGYLFKY